MSNITLKDEVALLRSAIAGLIGKDKEGEYHPEFVAEVFSSLKRKPDLSFVNQTDFLKQVEKA